MQQATIKRIGYSDLIQDDRNEQSKSLYFDDAAWVITSPMVNVAQRLFDEARRDRSAAMYAGRPAPVEQVDGEVVPLTISHEQAAFRRVHRAVFNQRGFGSNRNTAFKPF